MKRGVVVVVAGVLALAGCSSKTSPSEPTESATPAAHGSLAECLKSHGVTDSGGQSVMMGPPAGVDPATWDQAMKACSTLGPGPASP